MKEEQKMEVAIFRFGVIHDFVSGVPLDWGEQNRLLREKCERKWSIPYSTRTRLTRGTILRWIDRYKKSNGKLESLCPYDRSDRGASRTLDEETSLALISLRKEMPKVRSPISSSDQSQGTVSLSGYQVRGRVEVQGPPVKVHKAPDNSAPVLGFALKGVEYNLLIETSTWYGIDFHSVMGWVPAWMSARVG